MYRIILNEDEADYLLNLLKEQPDNDRFADALHDALVDAGVPDPEWDEWVPLEDQTDYARYGFTEIA